MWTGALRQISAAAAMLIKKRKYTSLAMQSTIMFVFSLIRLMSLSIWYNMKTCKEIWKNLSLALAQCLDVS